MTEQDAGWRADLERWLEPFLARLAHPARRGRCARSTWRVLIGPGERKSVQPIALHPFQGCNTGSNPVRGTIRFPQLFLCPRGGALAPVATAAVAH